MPKSIIREIDKSTTSSTLSANFSVFIPGYMGSKENDSSLKTKAEKEGIYYRDSNIYKLSSQKQFEEYIGKFAGRGTAAIPPTFVSLNPALNDTDVAYWRSVLTAADFYEPDGSPKANRTYFIGETIGDDDPHYGQDGLLYKVIGADTYKFTEVPWLSVKQDYDETLVNASDNDNSETEITPTTSLAYFVIDNDKFGAEASPLSDQIGNQMAYELLGLGYTVYFKPLSKLATDGTAAQQLAQPAFWEALRNKSTFRIRYLSSGGCYEPAVAQQMVNIARFANNEENVSLENADTYGNETGRGDCIALLDIDETSSYFTTPEIFDLNLKTKSGLLKAFGMAAGALASARCKYSAIFAPRVKYALSYPEGSEYSSDQLFPCSFHYLACAALAQQRYAEWYAVAGYTRGISPFTVEYTTYNFGDVDINTLAPRIQNNYTDVAINLILNERGNYYLWGNRTAQMLDANGLIFSHFLNIRQLCCTIKQVLFDATRRFTFDPNSDLLWINFCNAIRPTLETMKGDQGIRGYLLSQVATDKKALLKARIRIVPIEAVEDFDISIYLEDSLSGIIVSADESVAE